MTQYGLRAKISDPNVWQGGEQTSMPATVRNRRVNAVLVMGGIWHTKKQDGLCLQVTDLEFLEDAAPPPIPLLSALEALRACGQH